MSVNKVWKIKDINLTEEAIKSCGGNKILASLLSARGINTAEKINKFLNPLKCGLLPPEVFTDMQKAVERINGAITAKEHITVYGDFDADGITSTSLLYLTLKHIGADVDYYLPDRAAESHGLNTKALVNIISKRKSKLIITVDCGISNAAEVNFARSFKTDIIITDHHEAPDVIPDAYAIINPKAKGAIDENLDIESIESLNCLAGVGVAFKLALKLLQMHSKEEFVNEILPLAAIGTIGDIVELTGENRSLAAMGLELLKMGRQKGIQMLLKEAGTVDFSSINSETIAYTVVPRLNASGRLEKPDTAIKIFISEDEDEIKQAVLALNELNEQRQRMCDETFLQAREMYENNKYDNKKSIILFDKNWHVGIIGIVCSKLTETYNKPAFLMTKDTNNPNIIRCSCRSVDGINIHEILSVHKELFEGFGGHKMAAGFSFDETKISFEQFKAKLTQTIDIYTRDFDFSRQILEADMVLEPDDISLETTDIISKLEPFGTANTMPYFILNDATLCGHKMMGENNKHLKMFIEKNNSKPLECIKWNYPDFSLSENSKLDILFSLKLNKFNNITTVQLMVSDIHSELLQAQENAKEIKVLDHRFKKNIKMQVLDFLMNTKKNTAIYLKSAGLKKEITLPDEYKKFFFEEENIPQNVEQLMFFEAPPTKENFSKILEKTSPQIVHLMNFNDSSTDCDKYLTKLSGMLKYALSNLKGEINVQRAATALESTSETVECALELLAAAEMIDLDRIDENTIKISYLHPIELSKIKQNEIFDEFNLQISEANDFKQFYLNAGINDIKNLMGT